MDQARSTISKIFNGEPRSYTRFNLTENMEGDNSQVEMKLSSDLDEEVGGNGVGEHLNHTAPNGPYVARRPGRSPKNMAFLAATSLLIFIIGYMIGYMIHAKKTVPDVSTCPSPSVDNEEVPSGPRDTGAAPLMDWDDVKALLAAKLSTSSMDSAFSEFSSDDHMAGSPGDEVLGNKVLRRFKEYGMLSWNDEHFVKIQDGPAPGSNNLVSFKGKEEQPKGFLSYSATGKKTGTVLYAYYGEKSDFNILKNKNLDMTGKVILVRTGKISFAEKVANAASMKASAVLIYPDPDVYDYRFHANTELYGHVHLGSGDPYTPGFPSFNHTQFPPTQSSGLPEILAQTITAEMANHIMKELGGEPVPTEWGGLSKLGGENDNITVEVNNVLTQKNIHNVFGVIKGYVDPDRYVVIGAQRDAWGPGFAKSTVGTSILVELARCISEMVKKDEFKPRRSIVFASWSGGEYGSIGATEWLEGYLNSLHMKAFSYINLDGVVTGQNGFKASASPLMYSLIEGTLKEVKAPNKPDVSLYVQNAKANWEKELMEPMQVNNPAYPFLTFTGIPSASFRLSSTPDYVYFGTKLDTREKLNIITSSQTTKMAVAAAQFAGHMVLRFVHDHLLRLDVEKYETVLRAQVININRKVSAVQRMRDGLLPQALTVEWLMRAVGSYNRASRGLRTAIQNSALEDVEMCRIINDRIMRVEKSLLSPYVSPTSQPFRHILMGSGPHTLQGLLEHLEDLRSSNPTADANLFHEQFALATWTIQGCANALAGDIWSLDNQV